MRRLILFGLLCLFWGIFTGWDRASWLVGLPAVLFALVMFERLRSAQGWRIQARRIPGFAVWFLWHSLRGGLDVARRAWHPRLPLNPGFLRYDVTVETGPPRVFLLNCLSLLPGTLSAQLDGDELILHVLDIGSDVITETGQAEARVQRLFAIPRVPDDE